MKHKYDKYKSAYSADHNEGFLQKDHPIQAHTTDSNLPIFWSK